MRMNRIWSMPNRETFSIRPIKNLIDSYVKEEGYKWVDPFARDSTICEHTNDLNPNTKAQTHMCALEYLKRFSCSSMKGILFDPPYSLRQIKECYDGIGRSLTHHETKHFYSDIRKQIARIVEVGGIVISFGWSSVGIGAYADRGFEIIEILLVSHGGNHNDTICTVQRRVF